MVLPLWLSSKSNLTVEKLVYTLVDSQSDTTFINQEVSLIAIKYPVRRKLTTMSGKDIIVKSESVSGLRVR